MPIVTEFFSTLKGAIGKMRGAAYTALIGSGCEHVRRWLVVSLGGTEEGTFWGL